MNHPYTPGLLATQRAANKKGDRAEPYVVKGEQLQWGLASGYSLYPATTKEDRHVPDLISIARNGAVELDVTRSIDSLYFKLHCYTC